MNNIQLYLNDLLVDLSEDSPIALTFQINDLAEVKNQQGNTSNQFKLPLTQNNRIILGYADDISFCDSTLTSQIAYTKLSARIIQNGIEILPNAIAEINEVDDDSASITILSGNVDFFDALGGQIADMGDSTSQWSNYGTTLLWKPFDHTWNVYNAAYSQKYTEQDGWIYPVIDYGKIEPYSFATQKIDVRNLRPGFFIKKAVDLLVKSTGYTAKGSLLADPLYPLLIAQFSNSSFEHGIDFQTSENQTVALELGSDLIVVNSSLAYKGNISWQTLKTNWNNQFVSGHGFTASQPEKVLVTVNIPHLQLTGVTTTNHVTQLDIIMYKTSPGLAPTSITNLHYDFTAGYTNVQSAPPLTIGTAAIDHKIMTATVDLNTGEGIYIGYTFSGPYLGSFTMAGTSSWTVAAQNSEVKFGQEVQCERILPDMSQKDFLKDTFQRFGIMCQTDVYNKTINFASLKDIINNIPIANDWTQKCVDQGKQINYKLGNYAQVNNMEYQTDANLLPLKYGWDQLTVNDQTLSSTPADLIVSKFGPSFNRPYIGGSIAKIGMMDPTSESDDFTISVAPRLLIDQKLDLIKNSLPAVTFSDGTTDIVVNDVISTPYFYKPDGEYSLCWCDLPPGQTVSIPGLKTRYYSDLQKILQNTKLLIRYFLLTPRDIAELDLLIPIYLQQHNAYFYINKIDAWRKGQPCKVELVRVG